MTLPLHPALKARLLPLMIQAIKESTFDGRYLNGQAVYQLADACSKKLSNKVELNQLLEQYVDDLKPIMWAAYCFISEKLEQADLTTFPDDDREARIPLHNVDAFKDPVAAGTELLDLIANLPYSYTCSIELPGRAASEWKKHKIPAVVGETIAIVGSWHAEAAQYPVPPDPPVPTTDGPPLGLLSHLFELEKPALQKPSTSLAIHIRVKGLISHQVSTAPAEEAIRILKSFVGLSLAANLFVRQPSFVAESDSIAHYYHAEDTANRLTLKTLDRALSRLIQSLSVRGTQPDFAKCLKDLVSIVDGNPRSDQLVLAGRWLCDSFANHDKVMAFMQSAIVIEVLLGGSDREDVGLTTLLSNRCAYLLAKTTDERDALLKSFPKIYKTRSKIVHTGLGVLKSEEAEQFRELRKLCNRVIQVEIAQLLATRPAPPAHPDF